MSAAPPNADRWPMPWDRLPCLLLCLSADGRAIDLNADACAFFEAAAIDWGPLPSYGWLDALTAPSRARLLQALAGRHEVRLLLQRAGHAGCLQLAARWQPRMLADHAALLASGERPEPAVRADADVGEFLAVLSDPGIDGAAEQQARDAEQRLDKFMQASSEGIMFHRDGVLTDANPALCELLGRTLADLVGCPIDQFTAPDQVARQAAMIASGADASYESAVVDRDGRRIPVQCTVRTLWRNGEASRMALLRDLRDRHEAQARIEQLAFRDTLTGLPNRAAFMLQLDELLLQPASDTPRALALLFVDLDHFKRVNDSLGHTVGDTLLRTVATRIVAAVRSADRVARFGGDEFMVLLPGVEARADVEVVALNLLQAIARPVTAEGRPISVTPSIGIALYPDHGDSAAALVKHADTAMYLAKARGRACHLFFDHAMATGAYDALVLEGELAQALQRGEFALHFQPQVSARGNQLTGAEALIRWNHPARGLLRPVDFIELAEQQRLMVPIGQWVLREAARWAARWHAQGLNVGPIAVNLSSMQFQAAGFVDSVARVLREEGTDGRLIELELTERMVLDDLDAVNATLGRLAQLGIRISVDDFGTGYSSLGQLKDLPIDKMKIDASFVRDLPHDRSSAAIARALIQMGKKLRITVIAEGVETEAQWSFLANAGCAELQGDLISKPLPTTEFEGWLVARRRLSSDSPPASLSAVVTSAP